MAEKAVFFAYINGVRTELAPKTSDEAVHTGDTTLDEKLAAMTPGTAEIVQDVLASEQLQQMQQDIADLKYVPIDITAISNSVGTVEMGRTVDEVTVSWTVNKTPASQTLDGEAVDAALRSKTLTGLALTAGKTFTVAVTDERDATDSAGTAVAFLNGVYYGLLADGATIDSAAVLGLTRKLQSGKGITFTATAAGTQRIAYALPARYGTPVFAVGGFEGGFTLAQTFDFTNASGYTESYSVYLSDNTGLGETTVKVS